MLTRYQRNRLLLIAAAALSYALFWCAGRWLDVPRHPDFEASLALQPRPAAVLLAVGCVIGVCVAVSTAVTSTVRLDAGLFAACVGLMALSVRGGPMRYVFQAARGRDVFLSMALELIVLYAFLALAWLALWMLQRGGTLAGDALRDGLADQEHTHGERLSALALQTATTAALMMFFARSDDKKQVLAAIWVSSFVATLLAYTFTPVRPSVWFWAGPLFVGIAGYVSGYMNWGRGGPSLWKAGLGAGPLAPLGRPRRSWGIG